MSGKIPIVRELVFRNLITAEFDNMLTTDFIHTNFKNYRTPRLCDSGFERSKSEVTGSKT
jgi:hypothetical protein